MSAACFVDAGVRDAQPRTIESTIVHDHCSTRPEYEAISSAIVQAVISTTLQPLSYQPAAARHRRIGEPAKQTSKMCTPPKTPVVVEAPKDAVERRVTAAAQTRLRVTRGEETRMPTAHGDFDAVCYTETNSGLEHGLDERRVSAAQAPLARVHSECATGDIFGSRRCDCGGNYKVAAINCRGGRRRADLPAGPGGPRHRKNAKLTAYAARSR